MDYSEHLAKHEAKQKELELQHEEAQRRKLIALEESFREAESIVKGVIQPELETLSAALVQHNFPAKVTIKRDVSDLSPDSVFETGIELREETNGDSVARGIIFTAEPHSKVFGVVVSASRNPGQQRERSELKFGEVTAQSVQGVCANFMRKAFVL